MTPPEAPTGDLDPPKLPAGQVTFLFTDIEASTRLAQVLGSDYRQVLLQHRAILRQAVARCEGAELLSEGDSCFVAFPDARAALLACIDAQRAISGHPWSTPSRPRVRMGLHTGYAVPHGGEYASQEVHRAARVAAAAHGGQVLCSAATAASADSLPAGAWLNDLGSHRLRGFDDRERLYQLMAPGLERHFPRPRTEDPTCHNLPASATSFVGRVPEQAELRALISAHRLVTVSGPGGAGKTRLAIQVAAGLTGSYPDGVWFVDLAAASDPALVPVSMAAAFGLRPEPGRPVIDTLAEHARRCRSLLLLDTCEHQREHLVPLVSRLLASCPSLTVVATSREPLGLAGELVWRIPPMSLGSHNGHGPGDAVRLLLDRATAARGGHLDLSPSGAGHLEGVARRLDGLPLALELAAPRLRVLSPEDLADRLDDVLGVLDDPGPPAAPDGPLGSDPSRRHSTLSTTMEWSYRTLGPRAARLLRWMAVFAARVDLDAIESVFGEPPLGPLTMLVDKSLLQAEDGHRHTTYRMLDTIRAYAARELAGSGEETEARRRHIEWCLAMASHCAGPEAYPPDSLAKEIRGALHWEASRGCGRSGLRLVVALEPWWRERGLAREARVWLFRLYQRMTDTGVATPGVELAEAYQLHALLAGTDQQHAERSWFGRRADLLTRCADFPIPRPRRAG